MYGGEPMFKILQIATSTYCNQRAISRDLDLWAYANAVTLNFSRPGKPTDNGFIEGFNSKLWSECLNAHWFMSLADAREKLET